MTELEMEKNKQEFLRIVRENIHRDGVGKLISWLESTSFFENPCSTKFHLAEPGGLCLHSLNVYYRTRSLVLHEKPPDQDLTPEEEESIAIVSLLHDTCKVDCYEATTRNQKTYDPEIVAAAQSWQVKHDQHGDFVWISVPGYTFNDPLPYGHGEKSVYIVSSFIRLTREEAFSIRYHMAAFEETSKQNAGKSFSMFRLSVLLHIADLMACYLDEVEVTH